MEKLFGNKGSKVLITRLTSAIWHGVYPGYYIFFIMTFVMTMTIDALRDILPTYDRLENKKTIYAYGIYIFWVLLIDFMAGLAVHWLAHLDTLKVAHMMAGVHWMPVLIFFVLIIVAKGIKLSQMQDQRITTNKTK